MKQFSRCAALAVAGMWFAVAPVAAEHHEGNAEDVIARHIEAKGGREAWNAIDNLKLTGDFTAFSKVFPFTLHKTRSRNFHMDHMWGDQLVIMGSDGTQSWSDNRFLKKGATELTGADLAVAERERDFATPLFDIEALGHKATLLGPQDLDGQPVIAVEIERADESKETWYLDPETHLEVARDSPGSDFGRPMTQRTWFDDFQEVAGVLIPHYTETQWYTRHRVVDAARIEANVELDDSMFAMPPPFGMDRLQSLAGSWAVAVEARNNPQAPFTEREQESMIESHFRGAMFEESWTGPTGTSAVRTLSYDQFRDRYVATLINSATGSMDILAGTWNEEGALILDDLVTETPTMMFGLTIYERMKIYDIAEDTFKMERESSVDEGQNWAVMQKLVYSRKSEAEGGE
ncbi:MAG: DUF1579 family protein [Thermoanaerobaculia bacterium]